MLFGQCLLAQVSQRDLDILLRDPQVQGASLGLQVVQLSSGRSLLSLDPERRLRPASTLKLITTATALEVLGPAYRFETTLAYRGDLKDGRLRGDLILLGGGDPCLGSPDMPGVAPMADQLEKFRLLVQQAGIRRIEGAVMSNTNYCQVQGPLPSWQWSDIANYYGAGAWAINIHDNLYYLDFQRSGRQGDRAQVQGYYPEIIDLQIRSEVRQAGPRSGDQAYIYGTPQTYRRVIRGQIPVGRGKFTIKGSMPDPPLQLAQFLVEELERIGIAVSEGAAVESSDAGNIRVLYREQSPDLRAILRQTNYESVNLYAEAICQAISLRLRGTCDEAAGALLQHWQERGLTGSTAYLADGSGLSARNSISANLMVAILAKAAERDAETLLSLIPRAGHSGNLRGKFRGTAAQGRLYAKSGTIGAVRSYAGFLDLPEQGLCAFTLLINDFSGSGGSLRRKMDDFLLRLFE